MKIVMAIGKRGYVKIGTKYVAREVAVMRDETFLGDDCIIGDQVCYWSEPFKTIKQKADTYTMEIR